MPTERKRERERRGKGDGERMKKISRSSHVRHILPSTRLITAARRYTAVAGTRRQSWNTEKPHTRAASLG